MSETILSVAQRGRPSGEECVAQTRGLCLHDLALLRAVVQGMAADVAARRYLPELAADLRVVHGHLASLVREARTLLMAMGEAGRASALVRALGLNEPESTDRASIGLPSLEEFAESFPVDLYTERELVQLYREQYGDAACGVAGDTSVDRAALVRQALEGLSLIQARNVRTPAGSDAIELWLSARLCQQLRVFGVLRLRELVTLINMHGRNWYSRVPGLGRVRARRLVQWLIDHEPYVQASLSPRLKGIADPGTAAGLTAFANPAQLIAAQSGLSLRSSAPNALGAGGDQEALQAWFSTLTLKSSHTRNAYLRDVQRLLLWARDLSTLKVGDAVEHARFLLDPPAHWINALPTARNAADWRPMRGPLSVASANRALAAIGHLYGFLVESGYLVANPFARVRSVGRDGSIHQQMDTTRAFSGAHLEVMHGALGALKDGAAKRRIAAILALAETTGMRRFELADHTWGDVRTLPMQERSGVKALNVRGKGGQERIVPLKPSVVAALEAHLADRIELERQGVLPEVPREFTPLISIIEPVAQFGHAQGVGALSDAGLHRVLKEFFRKVAATCEDDELRADFKRASTHWLRHTFAHEVLKASGNDLPVTQQLLGHRNISTTGIYVKANVRQRVDAVLALPDRFA